MQDFNQQCENIIIVNHIPGVKQRTRPIAIIRRKWQVTFQQTRWVDERCVNSQLHDSGTMKLFNWEETDLSDENGKKINRRAPWNVRRWIRTELNETNYAVCKTDRFIFQSPHLDTTNVRHVEWAVTSHPTEIVASTRGLTASALLLRRLFIYSLLANYKNIYRVSIYILLSVTFVVSNNRNKTGVFTTQVICGSAQVIMYHVIMNSKLYSVP